MASLILLPGCTPYSMTFTRQVGGSALTKIRAKRRTMQQNPPRSKGWQGNLWNSVPTSDRMRIIQLRGERKHALIREDPVLVLLVLAPVIVSEPKKILV